MMKPRNLRRLRAPIPFLFTAIAVTVVTMASLTYGVTSADDQYLKILTLIEQGDSATANTNSIAAKAKYEQAYTALSEFKKNHPLSNAKAVTFRLKYLTERLSALSPQAAAPAAADNEPKAETKSLPKAAPLPKGTQIKLIAAGSEPRKALRFQSKTGDKQSAVITVTSTMGMGVAEASVETTKLPLMKFTIGTVTKGVSTEGDIDYELTINEVAVEGVEGGDPQVVNAMKESLKGVQGLRVLCTMSDRGVEKKVEPQIPANVTAEAREAIEQMQASLTETALLLPHEPIGPGAKWEVRQKLKEGGMTIDQVETDTLVSLEGDVLNLKSTFVQSAANQKIPHPFMPGATATLVKLTGNGTTTGKFNLSKLMPDASTEEEHTTTVLSVEVSGQKQNTTIKADSTVRLEAK
jgi:hypothetical protein